jgi:hypothetical protein
MSIEPVIRLQALYIRSGSAAGNDPSWIYSCRNSFRTQLYHRRSRLQGGWTPSLPPCGDASRVTRQIAKIALWPRRSLPAYRSAHSISINKQVHVVLRVESSHRGFHHKVARRQRSWELNSNLVDDREAGREGCPYDSSRRTSDRHRQLQRYVVSPNGENREILSGICWSEPGTPQSQDVARFSCNEAGAERGFATRALSG